MAPTTITSSGAPSSAASSKARKLSSRPSSSIAVRNPPQHTLDTRRPALEISLADSLTPASWIRSRHGATAPNPARAAPSTACFSVQEFIVMVLRDSAA